MRSDHKFFAEALRHFFAEIEKIGPIKQALDELRLIQAEYDENKKLEIPEDAKKRVALFYAICRKVAERPRGDIYFVTIFSGNSSQIVESAKGQFFYPLCNYIEQTLGEGNFILELIWRYKRLVEWFRREELAEKYKVKPYESTLDNDLRRYLMEQGIDFPLSQPQSPNGRADIVLPHEGQPLPLEVKIFNNNSYGKGYIKKGFWQAYDYTEKYGSIFGYLIVFNVADEMMLQFDNDGSTQEGIARYDSHGKVIFCLPIQLGKLGASSSRKDTAIIVMKKNDLIDDESRG